VFGSIGGGGSYCSDIKLMGIGSGIYTMGSGIKYCDIIGCSVITCGIISAVLSILIFLTTVFIFFLILSIY
jgi:Fe2+ transport system protein B